MSNVQPHFYLDEGLSEQMAVGLRRFGFRCERVPGGASDSENIKMIARKHKRLGVWLPRDLASRRAHRKRIVESGINVAWIRDRNGSAAKQCFLVLSFLYRFHNVIAGSEMPAYYMVSERRRNEIPYAVIESVRLDSGD